MPDLSQPEAETLFRMEKVRANNDQTTYPGPGGELELPLVSRDQREHFLLDINRSNIKLTKVTYNNRVKVSIILVRLDIDGPSHRNPDGAEVPCPHIHHYREGFGDKWAIPAPIDLFRNTDDIWESLRDFFRYCNIVEPPLIERGLF